MTDLAFQAGFVPHVLDGSKPFTLRKPWSARRVVEVDTVLDLVVNPRTPDRRVFASAKVEFRCSVSIVAQGFAGFRNWRQAAWSGPNAVSVKVALLAATQRIPKAAGKAQDDWSRRVRAASDKLAQLDGFEDWAACWAWHNAHRTKDAPQRINLEMIGLGLVTESFAA